MDGNNIVGKQAKELYDMGRGEYLSTQEGLSNAVRKGGIVSKIKQYKLF